TARPREPVLVSRCLCGDRGFDGRIAKISAIPVRLTTVLFEILDWSAATTPADNRLISSRHTPCAVTKETGQRGLLPSPSGPVSIHPFCSVRKTPGEPPMRNVINTVANVTTSAI